MSDIRQFIGCPRQFYLQYVLGAKRTYNSTNVEMSKADVGTLVHAGVESFYRGDYPDGAVFAASTAMRVERGYDAESWQTANLHNEITAVTMVNRYIDHLHTNKVNVGLSFVTAEHEMRVAYFDSDENPYILVGHVDLILRHEAMDLEFLLDVKTVSTMNQTPRPNDFQLRYYAYLRGLETGITPYGAGHDLIKRGGSRAKAPFADRQLIAIDETNLDSLEKTLDIVLPQMRAMIEDPPDFVVPNLTGECSWKCRVLDLCDGMDDGSDWKYTAKVDFNVKEELL